MPFDVQFENCSGGQHRNRPVSSTPEIGGMKMEQKALPDFRRPAGIAVLVGLAFLGTMFIRITIPATAGYFTLGDIFVILAGVGLGPRAGLVVGALGPAAADAIGFPQFILATAIIKGLEGLAGGLIAKSRPVQGVGV